MLRRAEERGSGDSPEGLFDDSLEEETFDDVLDDGEVEDVRCLVVDDEPRIPVDLLPQYPADAIFSNAMGKQAYLYEITQVRT